jgi:Acetyltransferases
MKNLTGKCGYIHNVFTRETHRRQGHSTQILINIIEEAEATGVGKIMLSYLDDGLPLYKKLGFEILDREMELKLNHSK